MSTAPGLIVEEIDASPVGGIDTDLGRPFIVAEAARGPLGAYAFRDQQSIVDTYGDEVDYSFLHDAAEVKFIEGADEVVISRGVSSTATTSSGSVAGGKLTVTASSPGDWADDLRVSTVAVTAGGFTIHVTSNASGEELLVSRTLLDALDAKLWSEEIIRGVPRLIHVVPGGTSGSIGSTAAVALTGGDDGRSGLNDASWTGAVGRIGAEWGPGTITVPGITSEAIRGPIADHCLDFNRWAELDLPRGSTVAQALAAAEALEEASEGARRVELWLQSAIGRARRGGTGKRTVPYSVIQSGLIARYVKTGKRGDPVANMHGRSRWATGLDRQFTDAERALLNAGGVSVARVIRGVVTTYSNRVATPSKLPKNVDYAASAGRTIMGIRADLSDVLEDYVERKVDGRGSLEAEAQGACEGVAKSYYDDGALYGATNDDAYENTVTFDPEVLELTAYFEGTPSPATERVRLQVARRPVPTT